MIRKLLAGVSVAAVAALALLLVTTHTGSAKPTEAVVAALGATTVSIPDGFYAQLQIDAEDDDFCFPNCNYDDLELTASAGDFVSFDPLGFPFNPNGCYDNFIIPCEVFFNYSNIDSNGFGDDGFDGDFCDSNSGPGDQHIFIANDDVCGPGPEMNLTHVEQWWEAPAGFPGGAVTFTARQGGSVKTLTITVKGAPAKITLGAYRGYSDETVTGSTICQETPVYVIAAVEYTFNNFTTFDNNRAILCADVRDSNNNALNDVEVIWSVSGGGCLSDVTTNTGSNNITHNRLVSCATGNMGDIATVTATSGTATASTTVQFGGDPKSCSIPDFASDLDVGDTAHVVATFLDSSGNWVPDGIIGHLEEVDSGDGSDNVQFVSVTEDTVKGVIEGDLVAAIAGVTTVVASIEQIAGADVVCSEALELTGDIHLTPLACEDDADFILNGNKPPAGGGFGTFLFCGGTNAQLLTAIGCPASSPSSVVVYYNKPSGGFAVWVVGSEVAATNAEWLALFPNEHVSIPNPTIFTAKCK